jgi:hypothetical protein
VTDEQTVPSVRDRLVAAGLSVERIEQHHAAGRVYVDGEFVDDLDQAAGLPARIVLNSA